MTLNAWRDYESRFRLIYSRLENPSEDEAQSLVLSRVPDTIRRAFLREQQRRNADTPTVRLAGIPGLTLERVSRLVEEAVGEDGAARLTERRDGFVIRLFSRSAMERLMMRNGAMLQGGSMVRLTPYEVKLSLEDLFRWVETELRCQERSDSYAKSWSGWPDAQPTTVQEVKAGYKPSEASSTKAGASSGKGSTESSGRDTKGKSKGGRSPSPGSDRGSSDGPYTGKGRGYDRRPPSPRGGGGSRNEQGKGKGYRPPYRDRTPTSDGRRSPSKEWPFHFCSSADHWKHECPQRPTCYVCNKKGHIARECPSKAREERKDTPPRRNSA